MACRKTERRGAHRPAADPAQAVKALALHPAKHAFKAMSSLAPNTVGSAVSAVLYSKPPFV